jgi:serine/threonine protein kinase
VRRQQDPSQLPNLLLADFGVAKIATMSKLSGTVRGTLEYMAPEQVEGAPVAASDQYALGIMVYELLTGRTPYQGALPHVIPYMRNKVDPEPPSSVNPSLPSALDRIVLQALAKKPQDRFTSVKEFASAFADTLKPSTKQPDPPKPVDIGQAKQQQISVQQKGQLSSQAYQFATTYQLGTPLEEFRVDYKTSHIFIGIFFLIISAAGVVLAAEISEVRGGLVALSELV